MNHHKFSCYQFPCKVAFQQRASSCPSKFPVTFKVIAKHLKEAYVWPQKLNKVTYLSLRNILINSHNNALTTTYIATSMTSKYFCFNILLSHTSSHSDKNKWNPIDIGNILDSGAVTIWISKGLWLWSNSCWQLDVCVNLTFSWQYLKSIQLINKLIHFMSDGIDFLYGYIKLMTFILKASLDYESVQ